MKRVLGVDPGLKRTGLALSDALGLSVRPLENRTPQSRDKDIAFLLNLADEHDVDAIAIGYALMPQSGDEGAMAKRSRAFAVELVKAAKAAVHLRPPRVFLVDERGSSAQAAERLAAGGMKKSKRKAALDSEAARILVEAFLAGDRGEEIIALGPDSKEE